MKKNLKGRNHFHWGKQSIILILSISLFSFHSYAQEGPMIGLASWYSRADRGMNRYTASGEVFDDSKLTCATWKESFGTRLQVTNLKNGKSVICRVNDRGPHKRLRRQIDLSKTAFKKIADAKHGVIKVRITRVSVPRSRAR